MDLGLRIQRDQSYLWLVMVLFKGLTRKQKLDFAMGPLLVHEASNEVDLPDA